MPRSFRPARFAAIAALVVIGNGAAKSCGGPSLEARVLAARVTELDDPGSLKKRCAPPSQKIAGRDYRELWDEALLWGNCADRKQRDWILFYDRQVRDREARQ